MLTATEFYKSKEWTDLVAFLKLERVSADGKLYCEHCGREIINKYDCIGHHEIELTDQNVNDYDISLNPENVRLIHFKCHNIIHRRFGGEAQRKVYLVYGPPCAGKTSWVHETASPNDLIMDMDSIWQAITVNDRYTKPARLRTCVFRVRDCIIDMAKCRTGKWQDAYIIGGYPMLMERTRLIDMLGATPIFIDTSKQTCIERAKDRGDEWIEFVSDWFEKYQEG